MSLVHSNGMPVGTIAPPFELPGVDSEMHALSSFDSAGVLVVVFTCNHCPYAKAAEDRLIDIQGDYAERGVRLVAINSNDEGAYPSDSFAAMRERASAKHFNFPYLHDATQEVARAYDAACTPDVFVFDAERRLTYNGRIDDNWQSSAEVTRRDLRAAIDAALEGRPLDFDVVPSMGCNIKWR